MRRVFLGAPAAMAMVIVALATARVGAHVQAGHDHTRPAATERIVASLTNSQGQFPEGPVTLANGTLYGTTEKGGNGCGTVFGVKPSGGNFHVVYRFSCNDNDGRYPFGRLAFVNGWLWGTTDHGGLGGCFAGCGTIFAVDPANHKLTFIYSFTGGSNGAYPRGGVIAVNGLIYGTTQNGGTGCFVSGCGTVFELNPATGVQRVVYRFHGADGAYPRGALLAQTGTLYGTTANGGDACPGHGCGVVFAIHPSQRQERVVYAFTGRPLGEHPYSDLVAANGHLWGTTVNGGVGYGTVFAVDPSNRHKYEQYAFKGGSDGAYPFAGVTLLNGQLYGTTRRGGSGCGRLVGCGTVFTLNPLTGAESVVWNFTDEPDGLAPDTGLTEAAGALYGTTPRGGTGIPNGCYDGCGTVFAISP